jgi:hypothetical protein
VQELALEDLLRERFPRDAIEAEKRATQRHWARRERQIERALASTAGLYGDIEGIVGRGIAQVLGLDLPALEARAGEEEQ